MTSAARYRTYTCLVLFIFLGVSAGELVRKQHRSEKACTTTRQLLAAQPSGVMPLWLD
jgi:hypothetical protein